MYLLLVVTSVNDGVEVMRYPVEFICCMFCLFASELHQKCTWISGTGLKCSGKVRFGQTQPRLLN